MENLIACWEFVHEFGVYLGGIPALQYKESFNIFWVILSDSTTSTGVLGGQNPPLPNLTFIYQYLR